MKSLEITTHEAKTHLSKYLALLSKGVQVIIKKGNVPTARLVAFNHKDSAIQKARPKVGTITSEPISYSKDCFSPLEQTELQEWGL